MKVLHYTIKRQTVRINVAETTWDLDRFIDFIEANPVLGFDTETTGLDWWNSDRGFRIRLAQFGNGIESWVLPVEINPEFKAAAIWALRKARLLIAHNGTFDQHVSERTLGVPLEELAPKMLDTKIFAHLVDPRQVKEGGSGLKLEELTKHYIDATLAEEVKGSMTQIAKRYKVKKADIWPVVKTFDPEYLLYAGMDPILAYRLLHILMPKVPARSKAKGLIGWEHRLAHITAKMERTGYLVDSAYAEMRIAELKAEEEKWVQVASQWVDNVNSDKQLIEAFQSFGFKLTKKTPKGNFSMDAEVLDSIDHPLAEAVKKATKAAKWRKTWFEAALNGLDSEGRVHASINSIQARTARMSISGSIAAQTFPAGDGYVRSAFLAEEGHVSASIDFGNMELRVMAAASNDPVMLKAFYADEDLHNITAIAAFGPMEPGQKKHPKRAAGKGTNFAIGFGGTWKAVTEGFGVPEEDAKRAVDAFWETYLGVARFAEKLKDEARRTGYIYTATGRRLPVDRRRLYSALNYYIQSTARDITARAIINLDRAGFTPYMRLPVHDELIFSFPKERAAELTERAARIMEFTFKGLLIPADGEIGDRSWGSILDLEDSKH
ncbi:DNA polymerase [Streptomyces argyrophyllae]|uniref:DNA polymerase I n=1 Tax=Streptomyces argyrophylli TaxID=2726118 RepID=A0A6M4PDJ1_9ACTN|nr:DNA polymerase [Streptomyces argyrophyllae]QJS09072.1 DNA polymerase [Streptomyces argyrophyllae]